MAVGRILRDRERVRDRGRKRQLQGQGQGQGRRTECWVECWIEYRVLSRLRSTECRVRRVAGRVGLAYNPSPAYCPCPRPFCIDAFR